MCARPLLADVLIDVVVGFFILVYTHTHGKRGHGGGDREATGRDGARI